LNGSGNLIWEKTLGGTGSDANYSSGIMTASDSGFLVLTTTWSNDGDVHGLHGDSNNADIWLVKLTNDPSGVRNIADPHGTSIAAYPNPSSGNISVSYSLDKPAGIRMELYDLLGLRLRTLIDMKEDAGIHEHKFDVSSFPAGSYFLKTYIDRKPVLYQVELTR